jgi:hypothetical protein
VKLRPYQQEVARAVMDSVQQGKGLTFSVEIARQGGKNELSAHLEVLLLTLYMAGGGSLVKCSPTFKPQTVISMARLRDRLTDFGFAGIYRAEMGYIISLGGAKAVFLSAEESSSVVGHTADILLEIDESQDVNQEKYSKEFKPMGASTNVTTVHYGTTWDDASLLEEIKQTNLDLERKDGVKRHFRYDWQEVGKYNPAYKSYVRSERERLGADHPLFRTQYLLLPIMGGGGFLSRAQVMLVLGSHSRIRSPQQGKTYIAGIDIAGEKEEGAAAAMLSHLQRQDSTVITIAEVSERGDKEPALNIVEHYCWTGIPHSQLYGQMVEILSKWQPQRVVVDATGIGQPVAYFLKRALGSKVKPFVFTAKSKSELGFNLLAFVNGARIKLYAQDGSAEFAQSMFELEHARAQYHPNQTMNFYVDPSEGHDDFLMSMALAVEGARGFKTRHAVGK